MPGGKRIILHFSHVLFKDESETKAETSLHAFITDVCDESANVGHPTSFEEESFIYNPMRDRQIHFFHGASPNKDVLMGDELVRGYEAKCE